MSHDYSRIEKAIAFLDSHSKQQPSLEQIAAHIHLSPHHFHRLFVDYSGLTPKQFLQLFTLKSAKTWLNQSSSLEVAALESGLSGTSRLHDHFVTIEAITPGEYKTNGRGTTFFWGTAHCDLGSVFIVWTPKGIHQLAFLSEDENDIRDSLTELTQQWPEATFTQNQSKANKFVGDIFSNPGKPLRLWVQGSNFQINIWRALLQIPKGSIVSYGTIAEKIGKPSASRAVGNAVGSNPIAYLIPCHRVIQKSGILGGYRWNPSRKKLLLSREHIETINERTK